MENETAVDFCNGEAGRLSCQCKMPMAPSPFLLLIFERMRNDEQ